MSEQKNKIDTIVGLFVVVFLSCLALWYFNAFGPVLGVLKWIVTFILGVILDSIITTIVIAVGAFLVIVFGKRYLKGKTNG